MSLRYRVQDRIEGFLGALFGIFVVAPCIIFHLIGAVLILVELTEWLKTDVWVTVSLGDSLLGFGYSVPATPTGYLAWDYAVSWALRSPFALWMILPVPLVWALVWTYILNVLFIVMQSISDALCDTSDRKDPNCWRNP
jgi:uncharacterized membrane protein